MPELALTIGGIEVCIFKKLKLEKVLKLIVIPKHWVPLLVGLVVHANGDAALE